MGYKKGKPLYGVGPDLLYETIGGVLNDSTVAVALGGRRERGRREGEGEEGGKGREGGRERRRGEEGGRLGRRG